MMRGWPSAKRPIGNLSGSPVAPDVIGNLSNWPNVARSLDRLHPINAGLVGWWPMDEMQGTRIRDLSINRSHAVLSGIAQPGTATSGWGSGASQRELMLDGTDDCVAVGGSYAFNVGTADFSVSAWVKFTASGTFVAVGHYGASNNFWLGTQPAGQITFSVTGSNLASGTGINNGVWRHLAYTRRSGMGYLFVDATQRNSASQSASCNPGGTVLLGGFVPPGSHFWPGGLRQVRFLMRSLANAEIEQLYADKWIGSIGGQL